VVFGLAAPKFWSSGSLGPSSRGIAPASVSSGVGAESSQTSSSVDTFDGKVNIKSSAEATVSSLGLMPFF
jgi:hypothetical protein